ncbi:MAG: hypothetical protein MPJ78_01425 [Hyphomicrobiaceae bacterium]|nr:hypothetical protein [Hyphomicrobiaceae bacterium]
MTYADQNIVSSQGPWARWWEEVSAQARAQQLESLEHGPAIPCPGPAVGLSRMLLLANLFQPSADMR